MKGVILPLVPLEQHPVSDPRLYEIPAEVYGTPRPIRRFVDSGIQASIERAVAQAGNDFEHICVVAHLDADKTVTLSAVVKMGEHLTVVAAGYKADSKPWAGEAAVRWAL